MRFQNLKFLFFNKELRRRQKKGPIIYIYLGFNFSCCIETFQNIFLNRPIPFGVTMPGRLAQWEGGVFQEAITVPGQLALNEL